MVGKTRNFIISRAKKEFAVRFEDGFDLEAGVRVEAGDKDGLERLCGYVFRPAFAEERIERLADGNLLYRFKDPRPDGSTGIVLTPIQFLEKLAALVAPPRSHLARYHGVLGPAGRNRARVVPHPPEDGTARCLRHAPPAEGPDPPAPASAEAPRAPAPSPARDSDERPRGPGRPSRTDWATLMKRTFGWDVLVCSECGGQMKLIAAITNREVARKILQSMGLPTDVPGPAPARAPPS